jgi:hypothetical protein
MSLPRPLSAGLAALVISLGGLVVVNGPAGAATQTKIMTPAFSGSVNPNVDFTTTAVCDTCYPDAVGPGPGSWAFGAGVDTAVNTLSFSPSSSVAATYDDSLLRQGQTLPITDLLSTVPGTMSAIGTLDIQYGVYNDPLGGSNFQPVGTLTAANQPINLSFACAMPLPGDSSAVCHSGVVNVPITSITVIPAVYPVPGLSIDLSVNVSIDATVNGAGVATLRSVQVVGGGGPNTAGLTFVGASPSSLTDPVHFSCTEPAGNDVQYAFTNSTYSPEVDLATTTAVHFEATVTGIPIFPPPATVDSGIFGGDLGSVTNPTTGVSLPLSAPDQSIDLGSLAKNNIPPVVDAGGSYAGNEGSPIIFDGSGSSSVCGPPTLRWDFSDGGVGFGVHPQHTFPGSGIYSGLLTATDATGLTSSSAFSVTITNLPPVVDAGPNLASAWGVPVAFNGSATDPGTEDQSTLTYSWDFGDGSPSATGGPAVTHSYSLPGSYTATLTSCDRFAACSSDTTSVMIRTRTVTAGYLGDFTGTYNTSSTMSGVLTDEYGNSVPGRSLTFSYNGSSVGTSSTSLTGVATRVFTPTLSAGIYPVSVSFAGDTLYESATGSGSYTEVQKASSVTYTGALTGGPNKTVTLSAVLKDATGLPLSNEKITFVLGSQTVSALTGSTGIATTSLKLTQKNGKYSLTATFAPTGGDANLYTGSSASATFALQSK